MNSKIDNEQLLVDEALLSTSNGYIGLRANFEEGYKEGFESIRGTYINGFYETTDVVYSENAFGFPQSAQKIVNIVDAQSLKIYIDDEEFNVFSGELKFLDRNLDIKLGYASRNIDWVSPKGHHVRIEMKRMSSFKQLELIMFDYKITSLNFTGTIRFESKLNGKITNYCNKCDPRVGKCNSALLNIDGIELYENIATLSSSTVRSQLHLCTSFAHDTDMEYIIEKQSVVGTCSKEIQEGESIGFTKYAVYTDNIRHEDICNLNISIIEDAMSKGRDYWFDAQKEYLDEFWKYAYVEIKGDKIVEQSLNYNIFQLLCAAGKKSFSNISAKGLSGEGYEGHYFWDTEIYMIPFFTLTNPELGKNLLKFRYNILDNARSRAKELGHSKGAKMPWRTIAGTECSSYFPAGTAQYHINADVAYSYFQQYLFTDDIEMMFEFGFEVVYETARIWLEIGNYTDENKFVINTVTGPDEYTAIVNNNYYTNAMAKYQLIRTVKLCGDLKAYDEERYNALKEKLHATDDEILEMKKAGCNMYLPFDKKLNIRLQDDGFLNKKDWDFENTPKENYPLLLHYHPLTIYRYKVLKQADTLLALMLLDNEEFDVIKDSFNYYDKYTTHDSSLSYCVHSIIASRINKVDLAYKYFMKTIRLDLDNLHKNTKDGLHIANAGGAYMSIVYGFGGLRIKHNGIHLYPIKPKQWEEIKFRLNHLNALITVTIGDKLIIETDKVVEIFVYDKKYCIEDRVEIEI